VPKYLSESWIADANTALADVQCAESIVMEYRIDSFAYQLRLGTQSSIVVPPSGNSDVTLTMAYEIAASIARGEGSAQAAFMAGDLRLGGDAMTLVRAHEQLEHAGDPFATLRLNTTYDDARVT
jgi:putative sterol carrier protein